MPFRLPGQLSEGLHAYRPHFTAYRKQTHGRLCSVLSLHTGNMQFLIIFVCLYTPITGESRIHIHSDKCKTCKEHHYHMVKIC